MRLGSEQRKDTAFSLYLAFLVTGFTVGCCRSEASKVKLYFG